jgi:predicted porin
MVKAETAAPRIDMYELVRLPCDLIAAPQDEEYTMSPRGISRALGALALTAAGTAFAQPPPLTHEVGGATFTVYGDIDLYLNYMHSSSGSYILAIQEGAILRSRLGVRGSMDLGGGLTGKFALEQGMSGITGAQADATRLFDRQAWVGLQTPGGELRVGRQNTAAFYRGSYIDYGERTLGAVVNAFGVPSRYDSDVAYISPRLVGLQLEAHYSLQGAAVDHPTRQHVYQLALDFEMGPFRAGYASVAGVPPPGAPVQEEVRYDNFYANFNYGMGKAYLVYIRSNNNGPSEELFNGGSPLGNTGALVAGTDTGAETFYNIYQASIDYLVTPALRVGGLVGMIRDSSGDDKNASGGSVGGFYLFKNITLYLIADLLDNSPDAGFRPVGSAGLSKPFTEAADVNGRTIIGAHLGFVYRF